MLSIGIDDEGIDDEFCSGCLVFVNQKALARMGAGRDGWMFGRCRKVRRGDVILRDFARTLASIPASF